MLSSAASAASFDAGSSNTASINAAFENVHGMDIANSVHSGILYLQDQDDFEWKPHFFVLTLDDLTYSEVPAPDTSDEDGEENLLGLTPGGSGVNPAHGRLSRTLPPDQSELHFAESWFHGHLEKGKHLIVVTAGNTGYLKLGESCKLLHT